MKLLIEIPTEFESHFNLDRFKDALKRLEFDANYLAGNYEKELAEMLIESFQNAQIQAKGHWIPIDEDSDVYECDVCGTTYDTVGGTWDLPYFCPHCGSDNR